jgi:hypothetical protein
MSLFDEVEVKMPLPGDVPEFLKKAPLFQTYDLGKSMGNYEITKDGEVHMLGTPAWDMISEFLKIEMRPMPLFWKRKKIHLHASNISGGSPSKDGWITYTRDGSDCIDVNYVVQIRNGKVSSIKELSRTVRSAQKMPERKSL